MKKAVLSIIIFTFAVLNAMCQDAPADSEKLVTDYVFSKITIKKENINTEALRRVFNGLFYRALPQYNHTDGGTASCEEYLLAVHKGQIFELELASETKSLDLLFSLLRNEFTIRNESDAKIFEEAIDALYPFDWSDDLELKKHFIKDGKWYFIRGEFFDGLKGFIVTLNQSAGISMIEYDLEAVKK